MDLGHPGGGGWQCPVLIRETSYTERGGVKTLCSIKRVLCSRFALAYYAPNLDNASLIPRLPFQPSAFPVLQATESLKGSLGMRLG